MKNLFIFAVFAAVVLSSCGMPESAILKETWSFEDTSLSKKTFPNMTDIATSEMLLVQSNFGNQELAVIAVSNSNKEALNLKAFRVMTESFHLVRHNYAVAYTEQGIPIFSTLELLN